jgi:hypothetical protein
MLISLEISQALEQINTILKKKGMKWLVGGSCGLLLQGVSLLQPPRDLDIYVDKTAASIMYNTLRAYSIDSLQQSETDIYISLLSHFQIAHVPVELVGGFEVRAKQSLYRVEVEDVLYEYRIPVKLGMINYELMPLAHELIFNLLRDRMDRYTAIAIKMRSNPALYMPPLQAILKRNTFAPSLLTQINELLDIHL